MISILAIQRPFVILSMPTFHQMKELTMLSCIIVAAWSVPWNISVLPLSMLLPDSFIQRDGSVRHFCNRGAQGIYMLVGLNCKYHIYHLPPPGSSFAQYQLSFTIGDTLADCIYLPPSLDNRAVLSILSPLSSTTPNARQIIFCGDFNARLGSYTGDCSTNPRGNVIYRWIRENNIILWNRRLAFGQPTFLVHQCSSIIDLFMSTSDLIELKMAIFTDGSLGSNHKMISFSFKTTVPNLSTQMRRVTWHLVKLKKPEIRDTYIQHVHTGLAYLGLLDQLACTQIDDVYTVQKRIEKHNRSIFLTIYDSLDFNCG